MPDDELMALAASGRLRDRQVLDAQVNRMLADPRASAFAENFAGQWLETRNLDIVKPDPDTFKEWDAELRDAMKRETAMFFEHVLRENRPVSDFLTADYTFLNARLAAHYGIAGVTGPEMRRVTLQTDRRGGVLSQAGVLTVSSYPTRTSPVIRGKYVLQNILGTPPEPPPGDIPPLEASAAGGGLSVREQLERHRSNPACAACHRNMDPLGFGLENYDAIGRWRDHGREVPGGLHRHAARRPAIQDARRDAHASRLAFAAVLAYPHRENDDLRAGSRTEAVRPPGGRHHSARGCRLTGIVFRRWCVRWFIACRSGSAEEKRNC